MTYIGMQRYEIIQQERNSADTNYITFYSLGGPMCPPDLYHNRGCSRARHAVPLWNRENDDSSESYPLDWVELSRYTAHDCIYNYVQP